MDAENHCPKKICLKKRNSSSIRHKNNFSLKKIFSKKSEMKNIDNHFFPFFPRDDSNQFERIIFISL